MYTLCMCTYLQGTYALMHSMYVCMYVQPYRISSAQCQEVSTQHGRRNLTHSKSFRETNQSIEVNHDV